MDEKKSTEQSCKTCFWFSRAGYCVEGPEPPRRVKGPCDKYEPIKNISKK